MNLRRITPSLSLFIFFILFVFLNTFSQNTQKRIIRGSVSDAATGDPVPFASVALKGTTVGVNSDNQGKFIIETTVQSDLAVISFIGYQTESVRLSAAPEQVLNIRLKLSVIALDEVRVKPQRSNYRNRNNPAVDLIEKVIKRKDSNRQDSYNYLQYSEYEKILFAISNLNENLIGSHRFDKFRFALDNLDTTKRISKNVLPVFIKESLSDHYFKSNPEAEKEIIRAQKVTNLNEYFDNKGVSEYFNYLYQKINIYDNEILFLTNKFLSPIANTAPAFYRYYILDTITVANLNCIKIFFEPRNKEDLLFHGDLFILMDSTYAVRKIDMGINKNINLDWIKEISITQDFENSGQKNWLLSREEILIDFGIIKNSLGLYGQRTVSYKDYRIDEPISEDIFKGQAKVERYDRSADSPGFWEANRHIPLSRSEKGSYNSIDSLKKMPEFRNRMKILTLVTTGFYDLGNIEIGPSESYYSYNSVEGSRIRFGGRTTTAFSKKITFDAYAAYGLRDRLAKFNIGATYSLTPRSIYEFPVKSVRLSYLDDTKIPGQELLFTQPDNMFLSFKRGPDDKLLINKTIKAEFLNEFENHFSVMTGYSFTRQYPSGNIHFTAGDYSSDINDISHINISEIFVNLRYAPDESFYQGKMYRFPFPGKKPVIQLKTAIGSKAFGNDYNYARFQLSISRRYYVSVIGYTDISAEAGKIFGEMPYQLLFLHAANQTYSYQKNSYNLMNFLEFVSDRYISLNVDHSFNGFILNKIPVISRLKLREIISCKVLYGSLGKNNNPVYNAGLFKFPEDGEGIPLTYTLGKKPYIEASVGLSNILRVFRVDFVKRITYLENPYVSSSGFLLQLKFDI